MPVNAVNAVNAVNDCLEVNARFGEYRSGKFTDHN